MQQYATITTKGHVFDGQAPGFIKEQLTAAMYEATAFLEHKVKANLPTEMDGVSRGVGVFGDQGGLRSTIFGEVEKGILAVKGVIAHQSKYGDVIEKGRTPGAGMPPKGTMVRWIEVKFGMSTDDAKRIEYVVRRKIAQKGFPGIHMFERALNDNFSDLVRMFDKYGFEIAKTI